MPSPVPFDFGRPISLRSDSVPESIEEMAAPTPQELLQIELDKIDEDQEVEYAGPRILPEGRFGSLFYSTRQLIMVIGHRYTL